MTPRNRCSHCGRYVSRGKAHCTERVLDLFWLAAMRARVDARCSAHLEGVQP